MSRRQSQLNPKKRKTVSVILGVIASILTVIVLVLLIISIWLNRNYFVVIVDGSSMNNTLQNEDRLYASYAVNAKRGDIIIIDATHNPAFANKDGSERLLIKRLIAVEGDTVECTEGVVYLNGEVLEESYISQTTAEDFAKVTVGEGEIFFLGDNRGINKSHDARASGCMNYSDIIGVVPAWSVSNKGIITQWEWFKASVAAFFTIDSVHRTGG